MFLNAGVPNPARIVIASVARLEQLTVERGFECLNVEKGHSLEGTSYHGRLVYRLCVGLARVVAFDQVCGPCDQVFQTVHGRIVKLGMTNPWQGYSLVWV
jgi:hypothetical protein